MDRELEDAVEAYWAAAYNEGKYDLTTDDGKAQDALNRIRSGVGKLEADLARAQNVIDTYDKNAVPVPGVPNMSVPMSDHAREMFDAMRSLIGELRDALRDEWSFMTPTATAPCQKPMVQRCRCITCREQRYLDLKLRTEALGL